MHGGGTITTLADFDAINGLSPGPIVLDSAGDLFGTTYGGGGTSGDGTVFEIARGSNAITTLAIFSPNQGYQPDGDVALDSSGNLFGTTSVGGAYSYGTVFEVALGSDTITTLASFNQTNGDNPNGVTIDSHGDLFGTTQYGGSSSVGNIFELAEGSSVITSLVDFDTLSGAGGLKFYGTTPRAGLTLDASGNLYGTTDGGGGYGYGTVFELSGGHISPPPPPPASYQFTSTLSGKLPTVPLVAGAKIAPDYTDHSTHQLRFDCRQRIGNLQSTAFDRQQRRFRRDPRRHGHHSAGDQPPPAWIYRRPSCAPFASGRRRWEPVSAGSGHRTGRRHCHRRLHIHNRRAGAPLSIFPAQSFTFRPGPLAAKRYLPTCW